MPSPQTLTWDLNLSLPNCQAHGASNPPPWNKDPDWSSAYATASLGLLFCLLFLLLRASLLGQSIWCQSQSESWASGTWHVGRQIIIRHSPPLLCSLWLGKQQLMKLADVKVIVLWEGVVLSHPIHRSGKQRMRENLDLLKTNRWEEELNTSSSCSSSVPVHIDCHWDNVIILKLDI